MKNPFESHLFRIENFEYYKTKEHKLIQIDKDKFQIIEYGSFKPILNGGNIIETELANLLFELIPEQIEYFKEAIIFRKSTNETWNNYYNIVFKNNLEINDFNSVNYHGLKIYSFMFSSIYLSEELKNIIQGKYSKINEIEFSNEIPLTA